jgi:type II secretory pathway component GspD/PulD (secretin)
MLGILIFTVHFIVPFHAFAQEKQGIRHEKISTFDFSSANIVDIIRLLSKEYNVNIVAGEEIQGKVSGHFTGTLEGTLKAVLKSAGNYVFVKEKDIFRIIPSDKIDRAYLVTRIITLKYLDAGDVDELVKELLSPIGKTKVFVKTYRGIITGTSGYSGGGTGTTGTTGVQTGTTTQTGGTTGVTSTQVAVGTEGLVRSNTLMVTDIPSVIEKIEEILKTLDVTPPQVMIEAKIMEVVFEKGIKLGIGAEYASPKHHTLDIKELLQSTISEGLEFSIGTLSQDDYNIVINAIQDNNKTNLLSSPRIVTLDNQPAKIVVTTTEPTITTVSQTVTSATGVSVFQALPAWGVDVVYGITLEVIPHVSEEGYITMRIFPEVSDKVGEIISPAATETQPSIGSKPILSRKAMLTQAVVKSGDTIVIGGLIKDTQEKKVSKIPILGDIPILGLPFNRVSKTNVKKDLIIFLTPTILKDGYEKSGMSIPQPEDKVKPAQTEVELLPVPAPQVQEEVAEQEPKPETPVEIAVEDVKIEHKEVENTEEAKEETKQEAKEEVKGETKEDVKEQINAFNKDKAKESFERALEYLAQDKYEEAKVELETSLRLNPDDGTVRQFLNNVQDWISVLEK